MSSNSFQFESAEQELHLFKFMADNVSDFVGMCDLDFKPFYLNQSGLKKVGLDQVANTDAITVADFFFEEDRALVVDQFFAKVKKERVGETEIRFRHFVTGEPIWMLYYVTVLKDGNGRDIGYATISRDISKHKNYEQALVESEERFRNLADQAPMFIWMVDENAVITYANRELLDFLQISHYSEVAVQGGWERVTHPEDIGRVYTAYLQGLANKEEYTVEARLFNSEKRMYEWFLFRATPRTGHDQTFCGFIGTAVSINTQKVLLEVQEKLIAERTNELKSTNLLLERSNHELEQFAYIASHDLQEPLRKIQTFAQLINERHQDEIKGDIRRYLEKIHSSAARMTDLIRDLLEFSRLTKDGNNEFCTTDLNKVLDNITNDFEVALTQKGIKLERDRLPVIEAVPVQMNQLFHNLIGNAIKFSKGTSESFVRVLFSDLPEDKVKEFGLDTGLRYFQIEVKDNGIGFSPQFADQIFTIFQRLNNSNKYNGYGIGLALCRKIVEHHAGAIFGTGEEQVGATFTIVLPYQRR